ncbi:putative chaperone protein [Breoghania corrubedonensis]|uniref:Putative chaperone protein n=1 Tax=Breoghania corrubedonensis TaxID=665038 RepID=A0A2T5VAC9_9HYPH|nr:Hsp70 family protein [Breoghania corrubedonensis]PTW60691.1 putative chaperone protein [Breoghania corrubedonensis]
MAICGIDFGTSNSSVGILRQGQVFVVPLDNGSTSSPSAMFFRPDGATLFGTAAVDAYTQGEAGRFMRALKSMLGHKALATSTLINRKRVRFSDIIGHYLRYLKQAAEEAAGEAVTSVVLGRPVFYVDNDAEADRLAEDTMATIARQAGFTDVTFAYEPVAAAHAHADSGDSDVKDADLILVVDLGGGTADFSLLRKGAGGDMRQPEILGSDGVHIGGTDLDYRVNVDFFMPLMGYGGSMNDTFRTKVLPIPQWYFQDLATWQRIPFMYEPKIRTELREIRTLAQEPDKIDRIIEILDERLGHRLAGDAEAAKIALSHAQSTRTVFDYVEDGLAVDVARADYEATIDPQITRIVAASQRLLATIGEKAERVDAILMTGGTSQVPQIQRQFAKAYPNADLLMEDLFATVCTGLTRLAATRFA